MPDDDWRKRISVDPDVCHGKACIKGTRVIVAAILDGVAAGETFDEILADFPTIERKDILAALKYGAELAREEVYAG